MLSLNTARLFFLVTLWVVFLSMNSVTVSEGSDKLGEGSLSLTERQTSVVMKSGCILRICPPG